MSSSRPLRSSAASSSSSSSSSGARDGNRQDLTKTANYEEKLLDLKKRLAWQICHQLPGGKKAQEADESSAAAAAEAAVANDVTDAAAEAVDEYGDVDYVSDDDKEKDPTSMAVATTDKPKLSDEERLQRQMRREKIMLRELDKIMHKVRDARSDYSKADEVFGTNAAVALAQRFICRKCGNRDPELIFTDPRTGDTICRGIGGLNNCGEVVQDHFIFAGEAHRNFEDKEDRNHHGPARDALMPDSVNMRTSFAEGRGPNSKKLHDLAMQAEMDLSNIGKDGRASTRMGYKTNQKFKAFRLMSDLASALHIHDAVISRAKEEFAKFREVSERVYHFEGTVVCCILLSYLDLAKEMNLDIKTSESVAHRDLGLTISYTEQLASIAKNDPALKNDIAIHTLLQKPMKEFTQAEIRQWLEAVGATNYAREAGLIAAFVDKVISGEEKLAGLTIVRANGPGNGDKKRKASDLPFVLHAGSAGNRARVNSKGSSADRSICNLLLVEPRLASLLNAKAARGSASGDASSSSNTSTAAAAVEHFSSSILRRSRFDVAQKSAKQLEEKDALRVAVEKADFSQIRREPASELKLGDDDLTPAVPTSVLANAAGPAEAKNGGTSSSSSSSSSSSARGSSGTSSSRVEVAAPSLEDELFGGGEQTFFFGKSAEPVVAKVKVEPVVVKEEPVEEVPEPEAGAMRLAFKFD